jgi:hypothetical protein
MDVDGHARVHPMNFLVPGAVDSGGPVVIRHIPTPRHSERSAQPDSSALWVWFEYRDGFHDTPQTMQKRLLLLR